MLDPLPGQISNVQQPIQAPKIDECAVIGQILDDALYNLALFQGCLLYTSPSPRDLSTSRMPSSA